MFGISGGAAGIWCKLMFGAVLILSLFNIIICRNSSINIVYFGYGNLVFIISHEILDDVTNTDEGSGQETKEPKEKDENILH